jgi:hypothetical protein
MSVFVALIAGCSHYRGLTPTTTLPASAPTASDAGMTASEAIRRAKAVACEEGLIEHEVEALASLQGDGIWVVVFQGAPCNAPDGREIGEPFGLHWGAAVYQDGSCYLFGSELGADRCAASMSLDSLDASGAIELASSCAARMGNLPTKMGEEAALQPDGTWLVKFTPGKYNAPPGGGEAFVSPFSEVVVAVDGQGRCSCRE